MKFFNARRASYHTNPKIIDEVIYTPYAYELSSEDGIGSHRQVRFQAQSPTRSQTGDLLGVAELAPEHAHTDEEQQVPKNRKIKFLSRERPREAEIFLFKYGTVVLWGMTEAQEKRFLSSMLVPVNVYVSSNLLILSQQAVRSRQIAYGLDPSAV